MPVTVLIFVTCGYCDAVLIDQFLGAAGAAAAGAAAAGTVVFAGPGVTAALTAVPALVAAPVTAAFTSAAFLATPDTARQNGWTTVPAGLALVGTIQPHAFASVLHDVSSRPRQTTAGVGAAGAAATGAGAAGFGGAAAAFGAAVAAGAGADWAEAVSVSTASDPATATMPSPQVDNFIMAVLSVGGRHRC